MQRYIKSLFLLTWPISFSVAQTTFYIKPDGSDRATGTSVSTAFATIDRARIAVREARKTAPTSPVQVIFKGGTYPITRPVVFGPEDSGTQATPVTYKAAPGETVIITGGKRLTNWTRLPNRHWQTTLPDVPGQDRYVGQIWVDGQARQRARTPNSGMFRVADLHDTPEETQQKTHKRFEYKKGDIRPEWANDPDARVVVYHFWNDLHLPIQSIDSTRNMVEFRRHARKPFNDDFNGQRARYFIENVPDALDAPGEWYLERKTGRLTYIPLPGEDPARTEVIAPVSPGFLRFEGKAGALAYVEHLRFENLQFRHTYFMLPDNIINDGQASSQVSASVQLVGTRHCRFEGCSFTQLGNYAIELGDGCQYNTFSHNTFSHLAAGGFRINGGKIDEPPLTRTGFNQLTDNTIEYFGERFPSAVGVLLMHTQGNQVLHNHVHHGYYTGISVGWVWGYLPSISRDNKIEYNHIHDIGQGLLSDMGAIYTLGLSPGTTIRNNLIHHVDASQYGGWGIYLDEGSSHILVENNIVHHTKFAGFNIHYSKEATVRNNIFALSRLNVLSRGRIDPHRSVFFENNILYWTEGTLLAKKWEDEPYTFHNRPKTRPSHMVELTSTFEMDHNLYFNPNLPPDSLQFGKETLAMWQKRGKDVHSRFADPLFVNPEKLDFTLKPDSPALKMGFQPIDMSMVGPRRRETTLTKIP
jgi:parallel beta-helix repeat protein